MCFGRGLVAVVAVLGLYGCAGKQDAAGPGQDCYRDDDCEDGFVCVANAQGNRVCSKNVMSLASTVAGPPAPPPADAGTPPDDAGTPPDDAGTP